MRETGKRASLKNLGWGGRLILLFVVAVCLFAVIKPDIPEQDYIVYNETPSMPRGIYVAVPGKAEAGDIVIYDPPETVRLLCKARGYGGFATRDHVRLLKRIGAVAGDTYEVTQEGQFFARGQYIGQAAEADSEGRPLPQLPAGKQLTVSDDSFLPVADAANSLDGRYTGEVPMKNIRTRVVAIPFLTGW